MKHKAMCILRVYRIWMYSRMNITDNKIIMMGRNDAGEHSTGGQTVGSNKEMLRKSSNVGLCLRLQTAQFNCFI